MQINRVIHGSTAKNASMSQSKKMLELKAMRNEKLDNHEKEGKGEWKSQDDDDDAGDRKPKRKAVQLQENLVEVTINNTPVQILCPPKRVQAADVCVKLDKAQLSAVFLFLQDSETGPSRAYQRSGKFAKVSK